MVDYNATVLEDLGEIYQSLSNIEDANDMTIVLEDPKKPGYDPVNGKYFISGAVTCEGVFVRSDTGANTTEYNGFHVFRYLMDENGKVVRDSKGEPTVVEECFTTRDEAILLSKFRGAQTSYIRYRTFKGNSSINLQPTPPKEHSFTQDSRVVRVYKTDSAGNRIAPLEFAIDTNKCTPNYLRMIEKDKETKSKYIRSKRTAEEIEQRQLAKVLDLKVKLIENFKENTGTLPTGTVVNPKDLGLK